MKYIFPILGLFVFLLQSCNKENLPDGYQRNKSGLVFKQHINGKGVKPLPGYKVFYHVDFRREDSVISTSRINNLPVELVISAEDDGNFLRESLMRMTTGDSLTMIRLKDSIYNPLPPAFVPGDVIYIDLAMKGMQTPEEVKAEKSKTLAGYSPSPKGTMMKKIIDAGGPKPKQMNGVVYSVKLNRGNSLVYSSYALNKPNSMQLPPNLEEVISKNPILEALSYMAVGDSLKMAIEYDSVPNLFRREWGFQSGDLALFQIRLDKILTEKEVAIEKQKLQAAAPKQPQASPAQLNRYQEVRTASQQMVKDYATKNIKGLKTLSSGLEYLIVEQGNGPSAGEKTTVDVNYSGFLTDGKEFDSSFKRGSPFTFTIGLGQVIEGWDAGVDLMNEGGKAYFFIPPNMAYGELGRPPTIPGNSILVFYVELVKVKI